MVFLRANGAEIKLLMSQVDASGELDFGIEWRDVCSQFDTLPSPLVRLAGEFGPALTLSHYPASENGSTKAEDVPD